MSIADIEKVREAEIAAEAVRKKADEDAAQIVSDGKREAKELLAEAEKEAEKLYGEAVAAAEAEAGKLYESIINEKSSACEAVKAEGKKKVIEVADDIVRKVVSI